MFTGTSTGASLGFLLCSETATQLRRLLTYPLNSYVVIADLQYCTHCTSPMLKILTILEPNVPDFSFYGCNAHGIAIAAVRAKSTRCNVSDAGGYAVWRHERGELIARAPPSWPLKAAA